MENYFKDWDGNRFDKTAFPPRSLSPQSTETLKRYKDEHTFLFEETPIIVSYHLRYTGNIPGRIYFYPYQEMKKGLICSVTTKLPTVTEPKKKI